MQALRVSVRVPDARAALGAALVDHLVPQCLARGVAIRAAVNASSEKSDAPGDVIRIGLVAWAGAFVAGAGIDWSTCDLLVVDRSADDAGHPPDLQCMLDEAARWRRGLPWLLADCRSGEGLMAVVDWLLATRGATTRSTDAAASR